MIATDGFRREQRAVARAMGVALAVTVVVLGIAFAADRALPPVPLTTRLRSALRADLFVVMWLAAAIANVARLRFLSERDIAGSGAQPASDPVRTANAILQNTLEQVVLAVTAHMVVVASLDRSTVMVSALAGLFAIGRLSFWIGYARGARGRAFGFALTFYPGVIALAGSAIVPWFG